MPDDGEYVCTLDEASLKKAKDELNEDPKDRLSAVEALRKLIKEKNPDIKCPMDTNYLLSFLRTRKFSQLEAVNLIRRHLVKRDELKDWYHDVDPRDPKIIKHFRGGSLLLLPKKDKDGRAILIIRPRFVDVKATDKKTFFNALSCAYMYIYLCDERTQVNGTVTMMDASKMTQAQHNYITMKEHKQMGDMWQKNFPARLKAFHLYNLGAFADFMLAIVRLILSEKLKKRVHQHGDLLESIYKHIPLECLPDEYLPDEYDGPSGGKAEDMIEVMIKGMTSSPAYERIKDYCSSKYGIDSTLENQEVPQASFRKLNID